MMNDDPSDVGGKAVCYAMRDGADQAEAYVSTIDILTINIENGAIKFSGRDSHKGIGIRVVKEQRNGFAFTTEMDNEAIRDTIRRALKISDVKRPDPDFKSLPEPKAPTKVEGTFDREITNLTIEVAKDLTSRIIDSAESYRKGIIPTFGVFESSFKRFAVVNSLGVEEEDSGTTVSAGLRTLFKYGEEITNGLAFQKSRNLKTLDPEEIGERSARIAVMSLKPRRISTFKTTVVLDPDAVAGLFGGVLMPSLYASRVQEKGSFLLEKLSTKVASEVVTIIDDGTLKNGLKTSRIDLEGVPTRRNILINKGNLRGYLYDTYSAYKDGKESTGNAVRTGGFGSSRDARGREYKFAPNIGGTNFILEKGSVSRDKMIEEVDDGVLLTFAVGGGSPSSGEFSVDARNVFRIESGEITYSIRQAIFAGNIMELLMDVNSVADNVRSSGGLRPGKIITPSIRVRRGLIIGDK